MIASLYHSGSLVSPGLGCGADMRSAAPARWWDGAAGSRLDQEDVRRPLVRVQLDVVRGPLPAVARVVEQVVDGERRVGRQPQLGERQGEPARLAPLRVEVDHDQEQV